MKHIVALLLIVQLLIAQDRAWEFERINFYFENDLFSQTDNDYTSGMRLSLLLYRPEAEGSLLRIPFIESDDKVHFISFSMTQQIFTPHDLNETDLIEDDRPYAGWHYFEMGLHQSSETDLDSLTMQIGLVGPASGMERIQRLIHDITGSEQPQGWDNQLNNELGLQLNYQHKWRYVPDPVWGIESSLIPSTGFELGNIAIKAHAGLLFRMGWNVPEDFGASSIDEGGENGIPVRRKCIFTLEEPWSFNFYLSAGGDIVARDLFLDGNTFTDSHSVDKKIFTAYGSWGISGRYKSLSLDYISTYHSEQFKDQGQVHSIGTVILSYIFPL